MKKISILMLVLLCALISHAQFVITGRITDKENNALIGASVQIMGTNIGTVSDMDGSYTLQSSQQGELTIVASFLGYQNDSKNVNIVGDLTINFVLEGKAYLTDEVIVSSLRPGEKAPGTISDISNEDIKRQNMGQDIPYLLSLSPSVVTTSDAGAGVGYTGFRIRGSDANRINVTVNGIPMNDAESHGVWWVNMPDFASSVDNIQIQRGVGTSTNGAGAFGATINMETDKLDKDAYAEISSAGGSFNTFKNTLKVGSGLLKDHFAFNARLSKITSDGFIDRAESDLQSYFVSGAYYSEKTLVKINVFSGKEKTYQSWNGVPKVRLEDDEEGMQRYEDHWLLTPEETDEMRNSDSRTYNYYTYENETDNYQQDHLQMFFTQSLSDKLTFNSALHYTYGRGYYEQYKKDDDLADYGMSDTSVYTDLVRQKWLSNDFYGIVASLNYKTKKLDATIGGAVNKYDGRHYGNVIWAEHYGESEKDFKWYRNKGFKSDINIYGKANYAINPSLSAYADLQYRKIHHEMEGPDDDFRDLTQNHNFEFFNPKAGLFFNPNDNHEAYILYARGNREPNRSNFTDADPDGIQPKSESMNDFELGYTFKESAFTVGANLYYMLYKDQLVLTGEINDVGSAIMTNVDNSYRMGIELFGAVKVNNILTWDLNLTLSQNKINDFTEYVDDWGNGGQVETYFKQTDIAFSPNVTGNSNLTLTAIKNLYVSLQTQFVSNQYIDNSSSSDRMLDAYLVSNLSVSYTIPQNFIDEARISLRINNLFDSSYETNAWVYSYIYGERYEMDGYFPQAGVNFMLGVDLRF